ncbi:OmpA family protein [Oscillatoria amoena NRMC-F 0135]|nr:OmpA family protein [Oscillatoria amoena NRMC-F 0135]
MKKWSLLFIPIVFFCLSSSAQSQRTSDSLYNPFNNPKVGDYLTIPILWGCSPNINPDVAKNLDEHVITVIKNYPNLIFRLESHSDCRADSAYNRDFTQRRAEIMMEYLIDQQVDTSRIKTVGIGEDNLFIKKCNCELSDYERKCTEAEYQLNRRTVLRIIAIKEN